MQDAAVVLEVLRERGRKGRSFGLARTLTRCGRSGRSSRGFRCINIQIGGMDIGSSPSGRRSEVR
jgi:hypothetical protein